MKALAILLAGSLAANAVLLVVSLQRSSAPIPFGKNPLPGATARAEKSAAAPSPATRPITPTPLDAMREADFRALAAQLRAAGYSDDVVRRVLMDIIGQHFKARRRSLGLDQGPNPTEFWKSPVVMSSSGTPEQIAGRRALEQEQRELFRALFGPDYDVSEDARLRRTHGLPDKTAAQLHKIFADYRDMEEQARADAKSTADIAGKLQLLGKEKRADIERLLTPEQLLEFDLRMGAGTPLHNRLGQFAVTEAEFRALYAAQKAFEAANPSVPPRQRNEQFEPELRRVLGEARYAELLGSNQRADQESRAFVEMRSFVMSHNLSPSVAAEVLTVQAQFFPQMRIVAQNPSLTSEQKTATRATLGAAARKELLRILGPTAFAAYEKIKGEWLPPMTDSPTPASTGVP